MSAPTPDAGQARAYPDTDQALAVLDKAFDSDITRHLVAISENGDVFARSFKFADRTPMRCWIDEQQGKRNVYYSVNELKSGVTNRKAAKENVSRALFVHVDVDDAGALDRIRQYSPKPTAMVFSGGGYQAFWKLREPSTDLARVEGINLEIARQLGGDNCHNIDRIMRLPGTINIPNAKKRKAGRVPALAKVIEEETDWSRLYSLDDFDGPAPAAPALAAATPELVSPLDIDQLPQSISATTRAIIEHGDDPLDPIGSANAHFPSRSEAVWRVACELARAGCRAEQIAGLLQNPAYGISASIREKRRPHVYAFRQARQALAVASNEWPA